MFKKITIFLMAFFYIYVGIKHFTDPKYFLAIMPPYFIWQLELIYLSGFFEIIFGFGLLTKYRKLSSWGLIILLIAVFPANIYLISSEKAQIALNITKETAIIRAPFQLLFIYLAYWSSID
ncbi:MAG: DoxX family protein [Flavobacteriaceae bacterium]|nr:DoxX family protein [Flavobacteriaceae bacterium]